MLDYIHKLDTFERIPSIYLTNQENFDLEFSFISSVMRKVLKKNDLNKRKKILLRSN